MFTYMKCLRKQKNITDDERKLKKRKRQKKKKNKQRVKPMPPDNLITMINTIVKSNTQINNQNNESTSYAGLNGGVVTNEFYEQNHFHIKYKPYTATSLPKRFLKYTHNKIANKVDILVNISDYDSFLSNISLEQGDHTYLSNHCLLCGKTREIHKNIKYYHKFIPLKNKYRCSVCACFIYEHKHSFSLNDENNIDSYNKKYIHNHPYQPYFDVNTHSYYY